MLGDRLFLGTLDAHLLAIDAQTGKLVWNVTVANFADEACRPPNVKQAPCYVITHAPLVVKNTVLVGTGGGDGGAAGYGIRGLIAAYDAATGHEVWRFHTIPGPGEPGHETWAGDSWKTGGAGVWQIGSYDAELNLTFWGVGNPYPPTTAAAVWEITFTAIRSSHSTRIRARSDGITSLRHTTKWTGMRRKCRCSARSTGKDAVVASFCSPTRTA